MNVAVVTGAGSGVGRSLAVELSKRGWSVGLIGHGETALQNTASYLTGKYCIQTIDVADHKQADKAAQSLVDELGTPNAWINCAAVAVFGPLGESDASDIDRVMAVSTNGVIHCSLAAARHMKAQGGAIINIGSSLAFTTVPYNVPYGAAKAAVRSFSLGLGAEMRKDNIVVSVAHLPAIATPWFAKVKTLTKFRSRPVGRMFTPDAVGASLADLVEHPRSGDNYLALSTVFVVAAARIAPRLTAWVGQKAGVRLQTTRELAPVQNNLWQSVAPPPSTPADLKGIDHSPRWWPRRLRP